MTRARQHRYRLTTPGRAVVRAPEPEVVLGILESLPRDGFVVLESLDEAEVYVQAWLRPDGSYQLEVREGSVATHVQTRSMDRARVAAAFTGWLHEHSGDGDAAWRESLQWNDISAELEAGSSDPT